MNPRLVVPDGVVLYAVPTAAKRLGMSRAWMYEQVKAGRIRTVDLGSGRAKTRIRSDDLAAFIDAHTSGPATPVAIREPSLAVVTS